MTDKEKLVVAIERAKEQSEEYGLDRILVDFKAADMILELLKEQEPVEPRIQTSGSGVTWWNVCGNCQTAINPNDKYCHECGRPVKWE